MTMNTTTANPNGSAGGAATFRPKLTFYHPNPRGTGGALQMDLHPAHDDHGGCIMAKLANQSAVGDMRGPNPTYARFDWANGICVKLDFDDLCAFLQVFRGECEALGDGKGLYHQTARATTRIVLRHQLEPLSGYSLEVYRSAPGAEDSSARIFLFPPEATGLCEAIAGSMSVIGFGIPVVLPHDTSAYEAENRERRHVRAA